MNQLQLQPISNTWIPASWEEYLALLKQPEYAQAKGYYYLGSMRLEMLPIGFDHGTDHSLMTLAVSLYGMAKGIPLTIADACSYRKTGVKDCQPDLSVYVGARATVVPKETDVVNLDKYSPPDLAIEISKTTLLDDLGSKRSLYEAIGVEEYWVVDVAQSQIIAYQVSPQGSRRISCSLVLPNLELSLLESALQRSKNDNQSVIGTWLMQTYANNA